MDKPTKGEREHARKMVLNEAICRCQTCRGQTDKSRLCLTCRAMQAQLEAMDSKAGQKGAA